jgi:hypothetical protein
MCSDEVHFLSERTAGLYWRSTRCFIGHAFDADINYSLEIWRKTLKMYRGKTVIRKSKVHGKIKVRPYSICSRLVLIHTQKHKPFYTYFVLRQQIICFASAKSKTTLYTFWKQASQVDIWKEKGWISARCTARNFYISYVPTSVQCRIVNTFRPSTHKATQKKLIGHANYQPVISELLPL